MWAEWINNKLKNLIDNYLNNVALTVCLLLFWRAPWTVWKWRAVSVPHHRVVTGWVRSDCFHQSSDTGFLVVFRFQCVWRAEPSEWHSGRKDWGINTGLGLNIITVLGLNIIIPFIWEGVLYCTVMHFIIAICNVCNLSTKLHNNSNI